MRTPVTDYGLRRYDNEPAIDAVLRAWTVLGASPHWHALAKGQVRDAMPVLARALDRLAREAKP